MVQDPRKLVFYLPHGPEAYGSPFRTVAGPKTTEAFHTVFKTTWGLCVVPEELTIRAFHPQNFIDLQQTWDIGRLWLIDLIWGQDLLVHIVDHLNLSGENSLAGRTPIGDRPRFPDISRTYVTEELGLPRRAVKTVGTERFRDGTTGVISEVCAQVALCARYSGMEVVAIGWNRGHDPGGKSLRRFVKGILEE